MESVGAIAEGDWSSLSAMFSTEEAEFMSQLLGNFPNHVDVGASFPGHEATMNMATTGIHGSSYFSSDVVNNGGNINSTIFPCSSQENYCLNLSHPMDFCMGDSKNTVSSYLIEGDGCLNQEISPKNLHLKPAPEDQNNNPSENSKKRLQSSGEVQKNKRNVRPRKNQKPVTTRNNEEDSNGGGGHNGQSWSSCCSEDDSNGSQELNGGATTSSVSSKGAAAANLNGKTRASRGSATDPQSLYARKRRERINERLRILQGLVPNGTKVDISTMLEEAVEYVKFLQLQIKLLSSDDLWMYAPLAYNGMDIGLDLKISTPR